MVFLEKIVLFKKNDCSVQVFYNYVCIFNLQTRTSLYLVNLHKFHLLQKAVSFIAITI